MKLLTFESIGCITKETLLKCSILFWFLLTCSAYISAQDCSTTSTITIVSESSSSVVLNVEGLQNDDLATNQQLCGVRLVFKHDLIENLRITLTSPSGQTITLLGPGRINSNPSPLINWNVLFVPCATPFSPDTGINGVWDNGEPWSVFTNYTGIYHPHIGCFEDFNMGSANGTWSLDIENLGTTLGEVEFFELIFCDPTGSDCEDCFLYAGDFQFFSPGGLYSFCQSDPSADQMNFQLAADSILRASHLYSFVYYIDDEIVKIENSANAISDLPAGEYTLCGLAYDSVDEDTIFQANSFSSLLNLIEEDIVCADLTNNCITLRILENENELLIDTSFCNGDTISFRGESIFESIDTTFVVSDLTQENCDSIIQFIANRVDVEAVINTPNTVIQCGETLFLNASGSSTNTGVITFFDWTTQNGNLVNDIGPIAQVTSGGMYYVEAQSEECSNIDSIFIDSIDEFDLEIQIEPHICQLDSFVINLSSIGQLPTFDFTGPSGLIEIDENTFFTYTDGQYFVNYQLGTCERIDSFIISNTEIILDLDVMTSTITCMQEMSTVEITTNATNPEFSIEGNEDLTTNEFVFQLSSPGLYNITLTDAQGCELIEVFEIPVAQDVPEFVVSDLSTFCNEPVTEFDLVINSSFDSIAWQGPGSFFSNLINPIPIDTGMYMVTVFNENGCDLSQNVKFETINVESQLDLQFENIDCENNGVELCVSLPLGTIAEVEWSFDNAILSNDDCTFADEEGEYVVTVVDIEGCVSLQNVVIQDLRIIPDVTISSTSALLSCSIDSIELEVSTNVVDNIQYSWSLNGQFFSLDATIQIGQSGLYVAEVLDTISKCSNLDSILIENTINSFENFDIDVVQPLCNGDMGTIDFLNPNSELDEYDIFINEEQILNLEFFENLLEGEYFLELIDNNGCEVDTVFEIFAPQDILLNLGDDLNVVPGTEILIMAESNLTEDEIAIFNWNTPNLLSCMDCLNPSITVSNNIEIVLFIQSQEGCSVGDTLAIIIDNDIKYFVPNVFSPNDDGNNDNMALYLSDGILKVFDLRIFDRWGNLVLFRPEIDKSSTQFIWDGKMNQNPVESGVYFYVAKLLLADGSENQIFGDITLIR